MRRSFQLPNDPIAVARIRETLSKPPAEPQRLPPPTPTRDLRRWKIRPAALRGSAKPAARSVANCFGEARIWHASKDADDA